MTTASGTPPAVTPASPLGRFVRPFAALTEPNYRWIWIGQLSASIGRSMRSYLRLFLVYELTGSAVWLGIVQGSLALPFLFLTFWGGVFADKFDRRRLLVTTEIMLVFLWAIVSTFIVTGLINEWWLAGAAILSGTVQSFSRPARMALVPNVVSRQNLPNAVALEAMAQSGGTLVGPAIGGVLAAIAFIDIGGAFWVTTFLQAITVLSLFTIRWDFQGEMPAARQSAGRTFVEGLRYMKGDVLILGLVMMGAAGSLFAGSYHSLLPVFAKRVWDVGEVGFSGMQAAGGVGGLIGAFLVANLDRYPKKGRLLVGGGLAFGGLLVGFAISPTFALALFVLAVIGFASMLFMTVNNTAIQLVIPDEVRGRVMSVMMMTFGLMPLGAVPASVAAESLGVRSVVAVGGILCVASMLAIYYVMPAFRSLDRQLEEGRERETERRRAKSAEDATEAAVHTKGGRAVAATESR